ncbi:MAG TPA: radical SAM protein [Myxococcota bacterium]|nr:radical SAM protein [Myxococcota bacterium]HRY96845.1 radical SAM protein [Myxococcota bacterium]HSA23646.1 radical SAM protein [Myxococcota bacterium]
MRSVYLRLSVHDGCDLRCLYCRPERDRSLEDPSPELAVGELVGLVEALDRVVPVRKLRLTGGEPLLRPDLLEIVGRLHSAVPRAELALTTNGGHLARMAAPLRAAGLSRVNVSLDTLDPEAYRRLTRGGGLGRVLEGLEVAAAAGFARLKLNTVLLRSLHAQGGMLPAIVRLAVRLGAEARFLELMPISVAAGLQRTEFLSVEESAGTLAAAFEDLGWLPQESGTARRRAYRVDGAERVVGFIPSVSEPFCGSCDRLRLTCRGQLLPCLRSEDGLELAGPLRAGQADELTRRIRRVLESKCPPEALWPGRQMSRIGG